MSDADLTAQFEKAAEAEAERGYRMHQLVRGSDVALALRALVGDDLTTLVRDRVEAERRGDQPSQAA